MEEDRFGMIEQNCKISTSQERTLSRSPFALQHHFSPPSPSPTVSGDGDGDIWPEYSSSGEDSGELRNDAVTPIVICSAPDTPEEEEEELFKTPPELAGSTSAFSDRNGGVSDDDVDDLGCRGGERRESVEGEENGENDVVSVEVEKREEEGNGENDDVLEVDDDNSVENLGFSDGEKREKEEGNGGNDDVLGSGDDSVDDVTEMREEEEASENGAVSEEDDDYVDDVTEKREEEEASGNGTVSDDDDSVDELGFRGGEKRELENSDVLVELGTRGERRSCSGKREMEESSRLSTPVKKLKEDEEVGVEESTEVVGSEEERENGGGDTEEMDDDNDYENGDDMEEVRGKLNPKTCGNGDGKGNGNGDENGGVKEGDGVMKGLWQLLRMIATREGGRGSEENDDDVDIYETAKRRGMTFPRPRWYDKE